MFQLSFQPLNAAFPHLQVSVVPWDSEIFGFPVGLMARRGDGPMPSASLLRAALEEWSQAQRVELICIALPAEDFRAIRVMEDAGFHTVEASIRCLLKPLREKDLPRDRSNGAIRLAEPADEAALLAIARSAFHFGRYHTDTRFPRPLADRRFEWWMEQAIAEHRKKEATRLLVLGEVGEPRAFMHLVLTSPTEADLRLAAVDPQHQRGMLGYNIFNGTLHYLAAQGCREAIGKISSTNIAVMNIYAGLGFRFQNPEMTMHWHAPDAPNLVAAETTDGP